MSWIYTAIGSYLILMGVLGVNLRIIWITLTFKIKIYDFEELYGRTPGRIFFIILGSLVLIYKFFIAGNILSSLGI